MGDSGAGGRLLEDLGGEDAGEGAEIALLELVPYLSPDMIDVHGKPS